MISNITYYIWVGRVCYGEYDYIGKLIAWFSLVPNGHTDLPTENKIRFYLYRFVLIADTMREDSYFISYSTSFDAASGKLLNFTKVHGGYHV